MTMAAKAFWVSLFLLAINFLYIKYIEDSLFPSYSKNRTAREASGAAFLVAVLLLFASAVWWVVHT